MHASTQKKEKVKRHSEKTASYKPKRSLEQLPHSLRRNHSGNTLILDYTLQTVT